MAQSEISRERQNIKKIIQRGKERGVYFDINEDLSDMTLEQLKELHGNIYDYAFAKPVELDQPLYGQDVKNWEKQSKTGRLRNDNFNYEFEHLTGETSDEMLEDLRDRFDFSETPEYDDYEPIEEDELNQAFSEEVMSAEDTIDNLCDELRDIGNRYGNDAGHELADQVRKAIYELGAGNLELGKLIVASNIEESISSEKDLTYWADVVARYYEYAGKGAMETRMRAFDNFMSILYQENLSEDKKKALADVVSSSGTYFYSNLNRVTPPKNARIYSSLEEGMTQKMYKSWWYQDDNGNWNYSGDLYKKGIK